MPADRTKRLAIMQPYLFPYLGYFQLLHAVDTFVFYDDVNFIKNGWINRNRLLHGDDFAYFTVPLANAGSFVKIHQVEVSPDPAWRRKISEKIRHAYGRAPHYAQVQPLLDDVFGAESRGIGELAKRSVIAVAEYLALECKFVASSCSYVNQDLKGEERVLDICRREQAAAYVNLPGGRALYSAERFNANGIELAFIEPQPVSYPQYLAPHVGQLSIVDVLMFNSRSQARELVGRYHLSQGHRAAAAIPS